MSFIFNNCRLFQFSGYGNIYYESWGQSGEIETKLSGKIECYNIPEAKNSRPERNWDSGPLL